MLSLHSPRDGETPSPHRHPNPHNSSNNNNNNPLRLPSPLHHHYHHHHFQSTVSLQKLRRFNWLILVFRLASFCFSLAASIFTATNYTKSGSPNWYDFEAFRYVFAANAIVAVYSLFEMGASVWEISRNSTLFPETFQLWFDFGHDQVFAYVLMSAESTSTALARTMRGSEECAATGSFCVQSDIAISLGFAGFLFLGLSSLLSGFRVACFLVNGSRFHL